MAGLFKPSKIKSTQQSSVALPGWMDEQLHNNTISANNLAQTPFQAWDGPSTTALTPDQRQAMAASTVNTGMVSKDIGLTGQMQTVEAGDTIGQMGGLGGLSIEGKDLSGYTNPFERSVLDATYADIDRSTAQSQTAAQGTAAKAGAFGGDRAAIEQAELAGSGIRTKATTGANLRLQGYRDAQNLAETDIGRQLGAVQTQNAADLQAGIANQGTSTQWAGMDLSAQQANQNAKIADANIRNTASSNLFTQGEVDRQAQEAGRSFDYAEFLRGVNDPYNKLAFSNGIASGTAPFYAEQNTTAVNPGPSGFSTMLGMGSLIMGGAGMMSGPGKADGGIVDGLDGYADGGDTAAPELVDVSHLSPAARAAIERLAGGASNVPLPDARFGSGDDLPAQPTRQLPPPRDPVGLDALQPDARAAVERRAGGTSISTLPLPDASFGTGADLPVRPTWQPLDQPEPRPGQSDAAESTGIAAAARAAAAEQNPEEPAPMRLALAQRPTPPSRGEYGGAPAGIRAAVFAPDPRLAVAGAGPREAPIPGDPQPRPGQDDAAESAAIAAANGVPAAVPTQQAAGIALQSASNAASAGEAQGIEEAITDRPAARRRLAELQAQRDSRTANPGKGDSRGTSRPDLQPSVPGPVSFEDRLASRESGNRPEAMNPAGYAGRQQFGAARLEDLGVYTPAAGEDLNANQWRGRLNIPGFANVRTIDDFRRSPEAQAAVMHQHIARIDKAIDATPGAETMNREGLRAVAHLGGERGMQRFIESGGKYDPADSNGTRLSDYYRHFSGSDAPPAGAARRGNPPAGAAPSNQPAGEIPAAGQPAAGPAAGIAGAPGPVAAPATAQPTEAPAAATQQPQGWQARLSSRLTDPAYAGSRFLLATGAGILGSRAPGNAAIGEGIAAGLKSGEHDALRADKRLDRAESRAARRDERTERRADRDVTREATAARQAEARADRLARQAEQDGRHADAERYRQEQAEARAENQRLQRELAQDRLDLARKEAERHQTEGQSREDQRREEAARKRQSEADDAERDITARETALADKERRTDPQTFAKEPLSSERVEQIRQMALERVAQRHPESRQARTWSATTLEDAIQAQPALAGIPPDTTPQALDEQLKKGGYPTEQRRRLVQAWTIRRRNAEAPNAR